MPSLDQIANNFDQHANFYMRAITNPLLSTFLDPTEPQTTEENIAGETVALLETAANRLHPDLKEGDRPRPLFASVGDYLGTGFDIAKLITSTPAKAATIDVLLPDTLKKFFPITEGSIDKPELEFMRQLYLQKGLGNITEHDYGGTAFRISGKNVIKDEDLLGLEPNERMRATTGYGKFIQAENGDIIFEDRFDQNGYKPPTGKFLETEEFEKIYQGNAGLMKAMKETLFAEGFTKFQRLHNLSFLIGSRDYVDDSKDVGREVRINIGNPDLDFAQGAYVDAFKDLVISHDGFGPVVHADEGIAGPLPRPTNIKLYKEKTLNTDYDDDIPEDASNYAFAGPMTNKRKGLFDFFIRRAEANVPTIPIPAPRPAKTVDVATPTSRPTMRDIQESQGDFAFEGPAA